MRRPQDRLCHLGQFGILQKDRRRNGRFVQKELWPMLKNSSFFFTSCLKVRKRKEIIAFFRAFDSKIKRKNNRFKNYCFYVISIN